MAIKDLTSPLRTGTFRNLWNLPNLWETWQSLQILHCKTCQTNHCYILSSPATPRSQILDNCKITQFLHVILLTIYLYFFQIVQIRCCDVLTFASNSNYFNSYVGDETKEQRIVSFKREITWKLEKHCSNVILL